MKYACFELVMMIERLHRLYLNLMKHELDHLRIEDINNVQCVIIYNIGTGQISVGELTNRGYYLGSNVSYNLKKMIQNGYIVQEQALHDKRSVRVRLSEKGLALYHTIDSIIERQAQEVEGAGITLDQVQELMKTLTKFETYWENTILKDLRI